MAWSRLGLPLLSNLAGPIQHFKAAILDAWWTKVAADLCDREGFSGRDLCWMYMALCSSLTLLMLEKEIRLCSRSVMVRRCLEWFSAEPGSGSACPMSVLWC